jgi:hypothetical protein
MKIMDQSFRYLDLEGFRNLQGLKGQRKNSIPS